MHIKRLLLALICIGSITLNADHSVLKQVMEWIPVIHERIAATITTELEKNETLTLAITSNVEAYINEHPELNTDDQRDFVGGNFDVLGEQIADSWLVVHVAPIMVEQKELVEQTIKELSWWALIKKSPTLLSELDAQKSTLTSVIVEKLKEKFVEMQEPFPWDEDQAEKIGKGVSNTVIRDLTSTLISKYVPSPSEIAQKAINIFTPGASMALGSSLPAALADKISP